jgi:hypothetical protein
VALCVGGYFSWRTDDIETSVTNSSTYDPPLHPPSPGPSTRGIDIEPESAPLESELDERYAETRVS